MNSGRCRSGKYFTNSASSIGRMPPASGAISETPPLDACQTEVASAATATQKARVASAMRFGLRSTSGSRIGNRA